MDSIELAERVSDLLRDIAEEIDELHVTQTIETDYINGSAFTIQCEDGGEYIVTVECTMDPKWLRDAEDYALLHEGEYR